MLPNQTSPHPSEPINLRRKIFEFLAEKQHSRQQLPSRNALQHLFSDLTDDVDLHLQQLAREGLLILDKDGGNGISLVPTYTPAPRIKSLGQVAQRLTESEPGLRAGSIALDLREVGITLEPGMLWVQVLDDRMSDAGINHGDIALVINAAPLRGDIVAVEEGDVIVLRRYIIVSGIPHFLAENPKNPALRPGWDSPMQGVLWGLLRINPCHRDVKGSTHRRKGVQCKVGCQTLLRRQPVPLPKRNKSPRSSNAKKPKDWAKPPSGIGLNEPQSPYRLTEKVESYDTWGPCHNSDLTASAHNP